MRILWYLGQKRLLPLPPPLRRFLVAAVMVGALFAGAAAPIGAAETADAVAREHDAAVALARSGKNKEALAILERLARDNPGDLGIARDRVVISVWAGRYADAVRLYAALPRGEQPAYVLAAVARAYRNLHRYDEALKLYRKGHARFPNDADFIAGETETLAERAAGTVAHEHEAAVALARSGKNDEALAILERLAREHPGDLSIARDRVVISLWAGRNADALRLYAALPRGEQPAYVLAAAARAYRNLRRYDEALTLYRMGHARFPADAELAAGEIETFADSGDPRGALTLAEQILKAQGEVVETLLAAAYAADAARVPVDALRYAERALARDPQNREAKRDRIFALEAMGAPAEAEKLAEAEPDLVSPVELRRLQASAAAQLVRWDTINPTLEKQRYDAADQAIAALDALIERWSKEPGAEDALWHARFDRLIALQDRNRMAEVVAGYEAARRAGIEVPNYVLSDVASAFLALRQPEAARDLYRRALAGDPGNIDIEVGLFHALTESEEFDEAFRVIDAVAAGRKPFVPVKGAEPAANADKATADIAAANARYYADDLPEAEQRFRAMTDIAPNDATLLTSLAQVENARGWPRLSNLTLERVRAQQPEDAQVDIQQARNDLALQEWRSFEQTVDNLAQRLPENTDVQRLVIEDEVHNRAELRIFSDRTWRSTTGVNGGNSFDFGSELYSPPIFYDWRLFSGFRLAHERIPEGNITERLYDSGIEYRGRDLTADAAAYVAQYGKESLGGRVEADWSIDDYWSLGGDGEIFSSDTPIRALKHDITANSLALNTVYRESESRSVKLSAETLLFSDGNERALVGGQWRERLFTMPHLRLDALVDTGASHNTRTNEPYFNPSYDAIATGGAELVHILYRHYELTYEEAVTANAGPYWEEHFGTGLTWGARYEQRVRTDLVEAALGLGFARQPYDGVYENDITLSFKLTWRF